jgi:pyrimidine and pyridine-specific 5'-nucleotidase
MTPSLPLTRTGLDIHRMMAELIGKLSQSIADYYRGVVTSSSQHNSIGGPIHVTTPTNQGIDKFFEDHLSLSQQDANELHYRYYREYGLAIEGLVRHHKVDALEYNSKVDDALPLEDIIKPNPELRQLIQDIDTSKVRLWLFTNAYVTHGKRVVKLLKLDDLFEGITFCDYGSEKFFCKPHVEMYDKAMKEAGIKSNEKCYFVGEYR